MQTTTPRYNELKNGNILLKNDSLIRFQFRVMSWWEEQEIKMFSIITEINSKKKVVDQSKVKIKTIDQSLIWIKQDNDKAVHRDDLQNKKWSEKISLNIISGIYDAYEKYCSISTAEFSNFRNEVKKYLNTEERNAEGYVTPPEVLEYQMIKQIGRLSRKEIREMSYVEFMKMQTVMTILSSHGSHKVVAEDNIAKDLLSSYLKMNE